MGNLWKVVTAFVGVFVAGTVFGGFFALGVGQRFIEGRRSPAQFTDPGLLQRYVERLQLTDEQKTRIKPILDKAQSDVNEIRRQATIETATVIKPIVEKAEGDLKKVLTAEQSAKLGDLQKNRDLNPDFQGRGGRGGGPPPSFGGQNRGPGGQNGFPGGRGGQRGSGPSGAFDRGGDRGGRGGLPSQDPKSTVPKTAEQGTEPAAQSGAAK
jgi:Spy/CpxP family protein refolding chaperone